MVNIQQPSIDTIELVAAAIGVIGTLLGTVLGWVLSNISKRGKLHFYVSKWSDSFQQNDNYGGMKDSTNIEETEYYSYQLSLDIYNSSTEPRIMRDIRIVFNNRKKDIEFSIPEDDKTKRTHGGMWFYDCLEPLTIPAKSVLQLELHNGKSKKENKGLYIWETKKIFLKYRNNKNRQKKVLLNKEDYSIYFENHPQEENDNE